MYAFSKKDKTSYNGFIWMRRITSYKRLYNKYKERI